MFKSSTCFFLIISALLYSCKNDPDTLFQNLDKGSTGINFQNTLFEDGPLNVANYIYFYN